VQIPVTVQGGVDDTQGDLRLLLHGPQDGRLGVIVQEGGDAPGEAGAERQDACMVVVVQGGQLVIAHCG
jgi:hypothetical protein